MNGRSDEKAVRELSPAGQEVNPASASVSEKQRVRMSHHVGKRSSVGTGRKAPYVEIQRDVGEGRQRSEQSKEFKLPKHHKNEPPTIRMEDVPSELTHWIEQGDLDGSHRGAHCRTEHS